MAERISYRTGQYSDTDPVSHIWEAHEDDQLVGELYVSVERGEILNIWVDPARRGEGIARRLYETAAAQMTVYHAPVAHRTPVAILTRRERRVQQFTSWEDSRPPT